MIVYNTRTPTVNYNTEGGAYARVLKFIKTRGAVRLPAVDNGDSRICRLRISVKSRVLNGNDGRALASCAGVFGIEDMKN